LMRHIKDFVYVSEVSIIGNLQRHTPWKKILPRQNFG
jgi:hypothetical protein